MDFQEKFFRYNGVSINYFQKGIESNKEIIIFLHGGGIKALTCLNILDLLSKKHYVIAPNLPCFGESTVPKQIWGIKEYADFFNKFIESLNVKNIILIGHSLGAEIALNLAVENRKIKKLIIADSAGVSIFCSETKFKYKLYLEKQIYSLFHYKNLSVLLLVIKDYCLNRIKKFREWSRIIKIMKKCLRDDFNRFSEIKAETLILWGKQDELFASDFAEIFHRKIVGSDLKIVEGNHDWILFEPKKFVELITNWLTSIHPDKGNNLTRPLSSFARQRLAKLRT